MRRIVNYNIYCILYSIYIYLNISEVLNIYLCICIFFLELNLVKILINVRMIYEDNDCYWGSGKMELLE